MYEDLPIFWISLVLFLGTTIACHIVFIWLQPVSEVFWKRVDYLWVGLAAFAIIGAISQVRTPLCRTQTPEKTEGCNWYDQTIKSLEAAGKSPEAWSKLSFRPTDTLRADFKQEAGETIKNIAWAQDEASRRLELAAAVSKQEAIAKLPLAASIFLLPIAFGIRITKVTAEVRLAKAKAQRG
jgi:hypothetical protein